MFVGKLSCFLELRQFARASIIWLASAIFTADLTDSELTVRQLFRQHLRDGPRLTLVSTTSHKIALILAFVYFAAVAGILFWPSPVDRPIDGALTQVIMWLHSQGLPQWFIGYRTIEFAANILLFVPFGIITALRLHRRWWWLSVVIGASVSGAVELAQGIFLPERVPAWSDIIANTSGSLVGALVVLVIWSLRRRHVHRLTGRSVT